MVTKYGTPRWICKPQQRTVALLAVVTLPLNHPLWVRFGRRADFIEFGELLIGDGHRTETDFGHEYTRVS